MLKNLIWDNNLNKLRQPFHCTIRITDNCNFSCVHCYQTPSRHKAKKNELNYNQWIKIIDILKENNIFTLTFTGGEIFTKKDFLKIYEYAYDNLFKIKLLTNLSLLNDEIINFLIKKPPILISTSLYGFSEKTYFDFTKKANMFNTIIQNIEKLQQSNIKIKVKVIANTIIKNELLKMESYFNKNKIDRFFYFKIHNFTDGDSSAKKYNLMIHLLSYLNKLLILLNCKMKLNT